jgi:ribose transport system permease protein
VAGFIGTPDVSIGSPYQLATITAAAIAGAAFNGGPASVASVLSACVFLQLLDQALATLGLSAGARVIAQGIALVVAVAALTLGQYGASGWRRIHRWIGAAGGRGTVQPATASAGSRPEDR